jgi:hypothetical protein
MQLSIPPPASESLSLGTASWLALLAATTLGAGGFDHLRVRVRTRSSLPGDGHDSWRLVAQSYRPSDLDLDGRPVQGTRPLSSVQRAVTREDLDDAVVLDLVAVNQPLSFGASVIAWVEPGFADLDFDGLTVRPPVCALFGRGTPDGSEQEVVLARTFT